MFCVVLPLTGIGLLVDVLLVTSILFAVCGFGLFC